MLNRRRYELSHVPNSSTCIGNNNSYVQLYEEKTTKTETPQQQAERDSAVDKVLLGYEIGTVSIATMVTGLERDGEALTLDLRLPQDSNPEAVQQELGQLLHPHGITRFI